MCSSAATACCGTTPFPSTCSISELDRPGTAVTQPGGSPIIHSENSAFSWADPSRRGEGAGRPRICAHRSIAGAYAPQSVCSPAMTEARQASSAPCCWPHHPQLAAWPGRSPDSAAGPPVAPISCCSGRRPAELAASAAAGAPRPADSPSAPPPDASPDPETRPEPRRTPRESAGAAAPPEGQARTNSRKRPCGAPTAEAGRPHHCVSYPTSARSPSTRPSARRAGADPSPIQTGQCSRSQSAPACSTPLTFSHTTRFGRRI